MLILVLSACTKDAPAPDESQTGEGENAQPVSLADYTIVRPDSATENEKAAATALRMGLSDKGVSIKVSENSKVTDKSESTREILIGKLDRAQSTEVLASLDNKAVWTIQISGNKIIVTSAYDVLLSDAVSFFLSELINGDGMFVLADKKVSDEYGTVTLIDNSKPIYRIITKGDASASLKEAIDSVTRTISSACSTVEIVEDSAAVMSYTEGTKDLILGNTCILDSATELSNMGNDGYGYALRGNKLLVLGATDTTSCNAITAFKSKLQILKNADGTTDVAIIYSDPVVERVSDYYLDFPRPDEVNLKGNTNCGNGNIEFIYSGAKLEKFNAYRQKLVSAGYTLYAENQIATDVYAATYTGNGGVIHTYFTASDSRIRVISAKQEDTVLAPASAGSYTKVTDSTLAMLALSYNEVTKNSNNGMSIVFTLEDGSYLIFDGGETQDHAKRLYNYLKNNNKRTDGKIVIAGWVLTHSHTDHYQAFIKFANTKEYASNVTVEYIYANGYNTDGVTHTKNMALTSDIYGYVSKFANGDTKIVKVHTGQKIKVRNAELDVYMTHEDFYPTLIADANDTSTVIMVNINGKKILMSADAHTEANKLLVARYGNDLKCDILQVPHHGQGGMTTAFAIAAAPTYAFFTTGNEGWTKYKDSAPNKKLIEIVGQSNICIADGSNTVMKIADDGITRI